MADPTPADTSAAAPANDLTGSALQTSQAAPAPSGGGAAASTPAPAAAPQEEWVSVADYARAHNLDLSGFEGDEQALQHLFGLARQAPQWQQLAAYGQEYLAHQQQFQQYLAAQQQQAQRPQQTAGWWNPSATIEEVNQLKARHYERDPQTGELRPGLMTPPSVRAKVEEAENYYRQWAERTVYNPREALAPAIQEVAQQVIQRELQAQQSQQAALGIVQRHAPWMFQADPRTGVPQYGVYTPLGMAFWQAVQQVERMGVRDAHQQEYLALSLLRLQQLQQQPAQQQPAAAPPAAAPAPRAPAHPAQHAPSGAEPAPAAPPKSIPAGALAQLMKRDLQAAGVTHFSIDSEN